MTTRPSGAAGAVDAAAGLLARVDAVETTALAAAQDAGGDRWFHTGAGSNVHAEPLANVIAVGPWDCGLFAVGAHIAAMDPRAVLSACVAVRQLVAEYRAAQGVGHGGQARVGYTNGLARAVEVLAPLSTSTSTGAGDEVVSGPAVGDPAEVARWAGTEPVDPPDPDLDTLTVAELSELDGPAAVVAAALGELSSTARGVGGHGAGTFLDILAAAGYRVTPIDPGPPITELLPQPTE